MIEDLAPAPKPSLVVLSRKVQCALMRSMSVEGVLPHPRDWVKIVAIKIFSQILSLLRAKSLLTGRQQFSAADGTRENMAMTMNHQYWRTLYFEPNLN